MEGSVGGRSGSTHSGRKARHSDPDGQVEQIENSEDLGGRGKPPAPKKMLRPKFERIEQVDLEIARLKQPPRALTREDFQREYPKLASDGDNPHRFRKGRVSPVLLKELFGEPYGDGGRQGYAWAGCRDAGVVKRIRYLHAILYQHPASEIPPYLKIHFAEGVAVEFDEGKGKVDWCAFGADTNKRQVNRYETSVQKLLALRKTLDGDKPLEVRGREWQKIKVEPGVRGESPASSSGVRRGGIGDRIGEEGKTKSRLGETADCGGTFESGMGSGIRVEGGTDNGRRGACWTEDSVKERGREVQELMAVLSLEMKADTVRENEAFQRRDRCKVKVEHSECLVENYENQKVEKGLKIDAMVGAGGDVDREKIKMEGIMEQLADEQSRLLALREELELAESLVVNMTHGNEVHHLQLKALKAELFELQKGKSLGTFWPRPMVYSEEKGARISDGSGFLEISTCSLCQFPFPNSDIIVSSCRHLYHPYCASVVFVHGGKCIAKGCQNLSHPDWHKSFGWGEPSAEMLQRAEMLGCAEEQRKTLQLRMEEAKAASPNAGSSYQKFAHPTSRYSPANFTEGDASQAISSLMAGPAISDAAVPDPLQGIVKDVSRKGGVPRARKNNNKLVQTDEVVYECLETASEQGKGSEPELLSGDESTSDDDDQKFKMMNLPDSSGTSLSSAEEADSEGEKSVDSKEREDSDEEDVEEKEFVKYPALKSYDPKFMSPQKPMPVKVAPGDHANAPVQQTVAPRMVSLQEPLKTKEAGEDHSKNTAVLEVQKSPSTMDKFHVQHKETNVVVDVTGLLTDDVPGSECLEGRNPNKKDGTPTVGAKKGGEQFGAGLENLLEICTTPMKKGKKMKEHDGLEDRRSDREKGVEVDEEEEPEKAAVKKKKNKTDRKKIKDVPDLEEVLAEVDKVQVEDAPMKETDVEVKDVEVGHAEKVKESKKGNSGGSKKRKKSMELEKEEEEFPTSIENLYNAKATTLTALTELAGRQGGQQGGEDGGEDAGGESEGTKVPSKSPPGLGRVMTRSQEKVQQTTQVKKRRKRRGT